MSLIKQSDSYRIYNDLLIRVIRISCNSFLIRVIRILFLFL